MTSALGHADISRKRLYMSQWHLRPLLLDSRLIWGEGAGGGGAWRGMTHSARQQGGVSLGVC